MVVKRDVNNNDFNALYDNQNPFEKRELPSYELMPSTPIANYAFVNNGDFTFTNSTENWGISKKGFSNGAACADLDNDGDIDIVINNIDQKATLYENRSGTFNGYVKIKLVGPDKNPFGIGTKVKVTSKGSTQFKELTLTRGYQSSTEPILHFGTGKESRVQIVVDWADGKRSTLNNVVTSEIIEISYHEAKTEGSKEQVKHELHNIADKVDIDFVHTEDTYDDFVFEPLLPHRYSKLGPALAVGDVNGDALDDFYIGNGTGKAGALYLQDSDGKFSAMTGPWRDDLKFEDNGALFLDVDNDNDQDLYVVSGSNHKLRPKSILQDRLYINSPEGFVKTNKALPAMQTNGQKVISGDYDNDGDLDLLVTGRIVSGKYPFPAKTTILRNDGGKDEQVRFTDVTMDVAPELLEAGLVTAALWDDFDSDGMLDIIITGEWMPIRFFQNTGQGFTEETSKFGMSESTGWWYALEKVDLDQDGDMDYLAGNLGLNYKYRTAPEEPFEIYANDFDENGTNDIVLSYEKKGVKLPVRGRECSSQQIPAIKKRFETYEAFAKADLVEIYGKKMLNRALHYQANTFAHVWIENKGDGVYEMHNLPIRTQFSSINAFEIIDYNGDQYPDVLLGGNLYDAEVETPRNDASTGLILLGSEKGKLQVVSPAESGLFVQGEIKGIKTISLGEKRNKAYLFAINGQAPELWSFEN